MSAASSATRFVPLPRATVRRPQRHPSRGHRRAAPRSRRERAASRMTGGARVHRQRYQRSGAKVLGDSCDGVERLGVVQDIGAVEHEDHRRTGKHTARQKVRANGGHSIQSLSRRGEEAARVVISLLKGQPRKRARVARVPLGQQRTLPVAGRRDQRRQNRVVGGQQSTDQMGPRERAGPRSLLGRPAARRERPQLTRDAGNRRHVCDRRSRSQPRQGGARPLSMASASPHPPCRRPVSPVRTRARSTTRRRITQKG